MEGCLEMTTSPNHGSKSGSQTELTKSQYRTMLVVYSAAVLFASTALAMVLIPLVMLVQGLSPVAWWAALLTIATGVAVLLRHWLNLTSTQEAKLYPGWDATITVVFVLYCLALGGVI